jgi:rubrerythrin
MTTQAFKDNDICITQAFQKIDNSNGKIFRVKFEYKDPKKKGKIRSMLARTKVRKNLKGVGSKYNPEDKGLRRVYDMALARQNKDENCYRHINSNIEYLKIKGKEHNVYKCTNLAKYFYGKTKNEKCPMCNNELY